MQRQHGKETGVELRPYYAVLRDTSLLRGLTDPELDALLPTLCPRLRSYRKGEFLLLADRKSVV